MRLKAGCEMTLQSSEPSALVAMLRPRSGQAQWIESESYALEPRPEVTEYVDSYGNLCQRLVAPKGALYLRVETVAHVAEQIATAPSAPVTPVAELPESALLYLLPSRFCPSDKLGDKAKEIVAGRAPGYAQVEAIRRWVHAWFEAYVGGRWYTMDATQAEPRGGRLVVAYGRDAADVALFSQYGPVKSEKMKVWVEQLGT